MKTSNLAVETAAKKGTKPTCVGSPPDDTVQWGAESPQATWCLP
jgi:hypothetical protein